MDVQYAIEELNQAMIDEIEPMIDEHYVKTPANAGIPPYDHDWQMYYTLESVNMLLIATARIDGKLVGYCMYLITRMAHHKTMLIAQCDGIVVSMHHRGKSIGRGLYNYIEPRLIARGVERITNHYRLCYGTEALFPKLGFRLEEYVYVKEV